MADAIIPAVVDDATMAKLNITYNGQQGDLPDPVPYDATDAAIKQMATESIRQGDIPGIDPTEANFVDFVVDRFPARRDVPFNRLSLRPKTPFGTERRVRVYIPLEMTLEAKTDLIDAYISELCDMDIEDADKKIVIEEIK